MTENKEPKQFKDTFNYESIDEDSIQGKNIEEEIFRLTKVETARYFKFRTNHRNCLFDENGHSRFGCSGGGITITIEPTGIGDCIEVKCAKCNKIANITDFDSF